MKAAVLCLGMLGSLLVLPHVSAAQSGDLERVVDVLVLGPGAGPDTTFELLYTADPTPGRAPAGVFTIDATFTNVSGELIGVAGLEVAGNEIAHFDIVPQDSAGFVVNGERIGNAEIGPFQVRVSCAFDPASTIASVCQRAGLHGSVTIREFGATVAHSTRHGFGFFVNANSPAALQPGGSVRSSFLYPPGSGESQTLLVGYVRPLKALKDSPVGTARVEIVGQGGISLYDVSDPVRPHAIAEYDIRVDGGMLFVDGREVAETDGSLHVVVSCVISPPDLPAGACHRADFVASLTIRDATGNTAAYVNPREGLRNLSSTVGFE